MPSDPSSDVAAWRSAIERLSPVTPPCRYLSSARWGEMRTACLDFLDRFGIEAAQDGWTASDLFGVHPEHGTLRVDWCGALMVSGKPVKGVAPGRILFEKQTAYRKRPGRPIGVPAWEFAARAARHE